MYPAARDKLVIDFNCGPSTGHEKETELEMIVKCIYRFVLGRVGGGGGGGGNGLSAPPTL